MANPKYSYYEISLVENCNLRCRYCSTGFGRLGRAPKVMSDETVDATIYFMVTNCTDSFKIVFSGGETIFDFALFRLFIDKLFKAVEKFKKKVSIEIATNGSLINSEIANYLVSLRIMPTFSIDGDRETTNRNRIFSNGKGAYDCIIDGIRAYRNAYQDQGFGSARLRAECTIDKDADLYQSLLRLYAFGFDEVLARPATSSSYTDFDPSGAIEAYLSSYRQIVRHILDPTELEDIIIGQYKPMFSNIHIPLIHIITGKPIRSDCGAVKDKICIRSNGVIVPCLLFDPYINEGYVLGDVFSGVDRVKAQAVQMEFEAIKNGCESCVCRDFCIVCYFKFINGKSKITSKNENCRLIKASMDILREETSMRYKRDFYG